MPCATRRVPPGVYCDLVRPLGPFCQKTGLKAGFERRTRCRTRGNNRRNRGSKGRSYHAILDLFKFTSGIADIYIGIFSAGSVKYNRHLGADLLAENLDALKFEVSLDFRPVSNCNQTKAMALLATFGFNLDVELLRGHSNKVPVSATDFSSSSSNAMGYLCTVPAIAASPERF